MHSNRASAALVLLTLLGACGGKRTNDAEDERGVTADKWAGQTVTRAEELLAGRFPGVDVYQLSNGGVAVRIRGQSSVVGSNEPLYVVDDHIIEPGPGGALMGINPADIVKIQVLKDIGSTSYYGARGANGVILISTKKGK